MDPQPSTSASAQPSGHPSTTAVHEAIVEKDFVGFEKAKRAELTGKPLDTKPADATPPPSETPAEAAPVETKAPAPESKPVSKRQERINEYERTIAELRAENARLRVPPSPPAAPRSELPKITMADIIDRPDLSQPPLSEQAFFAQFQTAGLGDYSEYRAAYRIAHARAQDARQTEQTARQEETDARIEKARTSMDTAMKDDAFKEKIAPLLSTLETAEQRLANIREQTGRDLTPSEIPRVVGAEHYFAGAITRSEVAAQLLAHLADHPDVLQQVRTINPYTDQGAADLRALFYRLEGQYLATASAPAPAPVPVKTHTDAPPPPKTLGSRPSTAADPLKEAVISRNYTDFERLKREELAAARGK